MRGVAGRARRLGGMAFKADGLPLCRLVAMTSVVVMLSACDPPNRSYTGAPFPPLDRMTCVLRPVHTGVLNPEFHRDRGGSALTLTIGGITERGAVMRGNNGSAEVEVRRASEQMHLIERTPMGSVTVTSIFAPPESGAAMPAVHSRHILIAPANVAVSQYAGECVPAV